MTVQCLFHRARSNVVSHYKFILNASISDVFTSSLRLGEIQAAHTQFLSCGNGYGNRKVRFNKGQERKRVDLDRRGKVFRECLFVYRGWYKPL